MDIVEAINLKREKGISISQIARDTDMASTTIRGYTLKENLVMNIECYLKLKLYFGAELTHKGKPIELTYQNCGRKMNKISKEEASPIIKKSKPNKKDIRRK